jgi:hypothetical protein
MDINRCYVGDCRDTLRELANCAVRAQMCVRAAP